MIRNRSFRLKLALVVVPPLVVLLALAAVVIAPRVSARDDALANLGIARLALENMEYRDDVQVERDLLIQKLASGASTSQALELQRSQTDVARKEFLAIAEASPTIAAGGLQARLTQEVIDAAFALDDVRALADAGELSATEAYEQMTELLDKHGELTQILSTGSDAELLRRGQLIQSFHLGMDRLADIGAYVGLQLEQGDIDSADLAVIQSLVDRNEQQFDAFINTAVPSRSNLLAEAIAHPVFVRYEELRTEITESAAAGTEPQTDAATWWRASDANLAGVNVIDQVFYDDFILEAERISHDANQEMLIYSIAAGVAALVAMFMAVTLGRSMASRISQMSHDASTIANERLPEVLNQLNSPTEADLESYLPQVASDSRDEIGSLADSFNEVLRTAVQTSLTHAQERSETMTRILVNLGRRNQTLLDRQLELLDGLEASVEDPDVLGGLFRLDHMLTRMRRNAENLLVLAAELPARHWTDPVSILDVVRGAAAEVQDHERVATEIGSDGNLMVIGGAAVDLSHVLAELLDNALAYSAPTTTVAVRANTSGNMVRLWVIDQGVGLSDADMVDANERLLNPPAIEAVVTDQVGFQVMGRLARRLGITVQLHPNPGGGLGACISLPMNLIEQSGASRSQSAPDRSEPTPSLRLDSVPEAPGTAPESVPTSFAPGPSGPTKAPSADRMPDLGPIPDTVSGLDEAASDELTEPSLTPQPMAVPSPFAPKPSSDRSASESASASTVETVEAPAEAPSEPEAYEAADTPPEPAVASAPRKRVPGAAIASGRETINAVEEGAFRRLPTSPAPTDTNRALERREAMSRLQAAVEGGRQETGVDRAPTQDPERSDI